MAEEDRAEEIPWHVGVFDAHCHPTDTLSSLQAIPGMRARVLTVMATRAEDQDLVAQAADDFGVGESEAFDPDMNWSRTHRVIPAFGWHPWFSHQIYDDTSSPASSLSPSQALSHYRSVLTPSPSEADESFLSSLPSPLPLSTLISRTRSHLSRYPLALIGEVGLDRSFRLPVGWTETDLEARDEGRTPGGRERRRLSPFRVTLTHQRVLLAAQLRLAGEFGRAASVHGVQAHGVLYETIEESWRGWEKGKGRKGKGRKGGKEGGKGKNGEEGGEGEPGGMGEEGSEGRDGEVEGGGKGQETDAPRPFPPRVCLHSFSGPAETVKQYVRATVPCEVFFSFSVTINAWAEDGEGKVEAAVRAVPDDRVLIESDMHTAGEEMDGYLADVIRKICEIKGWDLERGTRQLASNWRRFVFGHVRSKSEPGLGVT